MVGRARRPPLLALLLPWTRLQTRGRKVLFVLVVTNPRLWVLLLMPLAPGMLLHLMLAPHVYLLLLWRWASPSPPSAPCRVARQPGGPHQLQLSAARLPAGAATSPEAASSSIMMPTMSVPQPEAQAAAQDASTAEGDETSEDGRPAVASAFDRESAEGDVSHRIADTE
ncbi:unnamed protein product [Prorocentrum cordatum]|uniref:Glycerophosphocholine acyltransferase 1 n=1 Tax=Prorocentrum cordatum TaxID=2364126 RepID=A0ABN9W6A7_9DINO|nr:unnamed protein product [Polarella glacialis]